LVGRRSHEEHGAEQGADEGGVVGDPLGPTEVAESVVERKREQEGGDERHPGQGGAEALQQRPELLLHGVTVVGRRPLLLGFHHGVHPAVVPRTPPGQPEPAV